jgi:hypothetical protein
MELATRLAAREGLELRPQTSKNQAWYFQVRSPRFRQVMAYVNVSESSIRIDYRLPANHFTDGKAVARSGLHGIAYTFEDPSGVDFAMQLMEDALEQPAVLSEAK